LLVPSANNLIEAGELYYRGNTQRGTVYRPVDDLVGKSILGHGNYNAAERSSALMYGDGDFPQPSGLECHV
jgi:hypothetical protein